MIEFFTLLTFSLIASVSQDIIKENQATDVAKERIYETSWVNICFNKKNYVHVRVLQYGNTMLLDLKHMYSWKNFKRYSLKEDDKLIITFEDESIVTLYNIADIHSSTGGGAIDQVGILCKGVNPTYPITTADTSALKNKPIKHVSMYTSDECIEFELKKDKKELLINLLAFITEQSNSPALE